MKGNRRIKILLGIAVILTLWRIFDAFSAGESTSTGSWANPTLRSRTSSQSIDKKVEALANLPQLRFEVEKKPAPEIDPMARNPFTFGSDKRRERQRQRELDMAQEMAALETEVAETKPQEVPKPEFTGKVLGLFQDSVSGARIAIRYKEELFILKEGEDLQDVFRVQSISHESIIMQHIATAIDLEIPLDRDSSTKSW